MEYRNQCKSFKKDILVRDDCLVLSIPTAFSPNGDGINDTFKIGGLDFQQFSCSVYNRSGQLMNVSQDPNFIWDGRIRENEIAPLGNYFFVAKVIDNTGKESVLSGLITVIR